ncbi:MAG: DUF1289 domain-containing protein [Gammaproteobacteria bacterium]|uniref:DUF1289 domain-containing protein n=1 Tax=Pseudomaricurvus alcaniphilus TaxID=1166482 RepID=UPI001409C81D|nr:DUF1289 domain-containing protein [Pseudomaricurvus alcaniphilus]MBR9910384.1 DUF1289 domain-containing protein [Gammaproteobacteria bacterium]NHN36205.1 DUF1289 domain-containing protein [Pseudomaricurvus alcaniphilus]
MTTDYQTTQATQAAEEKPLKSPCVSICALDEEDVCVGCFRTAAEITHWRSYDNTERRAVLALARERASKVNPFF